MLRPAGTLLPEKRKVGSSTLPLTTSSEPVSGAGSRSGEPGKELRSPHDGQHSAPSRSRRGRDLLRRGEEPLRWAISVGFGPDGKRLRRKVTGRTKAEVRDKLEAAHNELDRGWCTIPRAS